MEALKKNHQKIFSLKQAKKTVIILIVALCFEFFLFPMPSLAAMEVELLDISQEQGLIADSAFDEAENITINVELNGKLPLSQDDVKFSKHIVITAYNSEPGQTDNSPCITANNFNVCKHGLEDTIAANFLPFGSKVKIPELFGERVFTVRDRMNRRFSNRVDVWMVEKPDAINFGVKIAKVVVLD